MPPSGFPLAPRKNNDPRQLGYWKLGRISGQGASGRVRIARHAKTGQMAAIKIIPKNLLTSRAEGLNFAGDEAEREEYSLRREVVLMKLIEHPNIMKLYDVWDLTDELFLVLEYVQGGELLEYLTKTVESGQDSIPLAQALSYFQQIILAVSYCHRFNVSHRDLKLENILVDSDNNIKIADFGLASFQPDSIARTACGSLHYCAPEVVTGYGNYNGPMADVWSCGIILFALLTCSLPFNAEEDDDLRELVLHSSIPFPDEIDSDAKDLISRMLTKDVHGRTTMAEVQQHRFFLSEKPKITYGGITSLEQIALPVKADEIDVELLRSLRTLWREASDEEITRSLVTLESNWQKGAYHLL
ncbi:kinase-like domain-containing protein, partial [Rhodocollybia butyracea]